MKWRDDIDLETTYVVSDSHFGHNNIVGFCHRPPDHESIMMERWAQAVPAGATVLHLGDLSYKGNARFKNLIAPHLTGSRKLLIKGNHDHGRYSFYRQSGFTLAMPFKISVSPQGDGTLYQPKVERLEGGGIIEPQGAWTISFSHYAWGEDDEGRQPENHIRVHGHIHNNGYFRDSYVPFLKNHINISVEQTKYRPVNLANLLSGYLLGTAMVPDDDVQSGIPQTHEKEDA